MCMCASGCMLCDIQMNVSVCVCVCVLVDVCYVIYR